MRSFVAQHGARWWHWLTLEHRLQCEQPFMLVAGPAALIMALVAPYRWIFVMAYCYVLVLACAYLWVRIVGPRVQLSRQLDADWAQVGDELHETWQFWNNAWLPIVWLEIADGSTLPDYEGRRVTAIGPYSSYSWRTSARCTRRGVYQVGPIVGRLGDPFGIFRYEWRQGQPHPVVIYPPLVALPPLPLPHGQRGGQARADLLQIHATPSAGGLREYARGDAPSRIHWPTVARTGRLMIKEFDQERAGALWIVLDLCQNNYRSPTFAVVNDQARAEYTQSSVSAAPVTTVQPDSLLELAIVLACSLAARALAEGRAVGLLANDGQQRIVSPDRGPRQLWRITSKLVDAQASGSIELGDLVRQAGHNRIGGGLAIITPDLGGAWLPAVADGRSRSGGAAALLVSAEAAHAKSLLARLATSGVAAHTFPLGTALPLLNPPKQTTTRISPFGRLIQESV